MGYRLAFSGPSTVFRVSVERKTVQHWLGPVPHTTTVYSAVLYTHGRGDARKELAVRDVATGCTESDAVINLVRSWRLPC